MADKADDVRAATREANEALADLKSTMKGLNTILDRMVEVREDLLQVADSVFSDRMEADVKKGLAEFSEMIERQIENATEATYKRFDTVARVLLGKGTDVDVEQVVATLHEHGDLPIIQRNPEPGFTTGVRI